MNPKKYHRIVNVPLEEEDDMQIIVGGIIILILLIVVNVINIEFVFNFIIQIILFLFSAAWAAHRAEILNRNKFLWGIFGFLFAPITLVLLGLMRTKIEIKPIKKTINEFRREYEVKVSNIENVESDGIKLKLKLYHEYSIQLKINIISKLTELDIHPKSDSLTEVPVPSNFVIWIGGIITSLFTKKNTSQIKNDEYDKLTKARVGYLFNLAVLISVIIILIYII